MSRSTLEKHLLGVMQKAYAFVVLFHTQFPCDVWSGKEGFVRVTHFSLLVTFQME
jgi:hypothetical protein